MKSITGIYCTVRYGTVLNCTVLPVSNVSMTGNLQSHATDVSLQWHAGEGQEASTDMFLVRSAALYGLCEDVYPCTLSQVNEQR